MHTLKRRQITPIAFVTIALVTIIFVLGLFNILDGLSLAQSDDIYSKYMLILSSDVGSEDGKHESDFLAVVDANPDSPNYGKVVNTATLPCIPGANLMDKLGIEPGSSSCNFNEAHHITEKLYVDPVTKHKFLFGGGLLSGNVFRFDVTNPLNIPQATLVVDAASELSKFSGTDDLFLIPNGNVVATYMGANDLTTPGGLVEFTVAGSVINEIDAAKPGGPTRYVPNINGVTDTGLLAHPHGSDVRLDLNVLIAGDFADPLSLAKSTFAHQVQDFATTVRTWDLSNLTAGVQKIIQVPDGPRVEQNRNYEEPEGLMSVGLLHRKNDKGAFTASMGGGALYYTPDITAQNPTFKEVYDVGPGSGPSVFRITKDDKFLIMPIAGIQSPGDLVYNRDYPGEHSRRVIVLDIQPLTQNRSGSIQCGPPSVSNDPTTGFTVGISGHNNGASDCPIEVVNDINVDSEINFADHGGPHFLQFDRNEGRFGFSNYFVKLQDFGLPGTGMNGDFKSFIAYFNKETGAATLDTRFKDELTGEVGINFNRPLTYSWPGARGNAGIAKPHAIIFIGGKEDGKYEWYGK